MKKFTIMVIFFLILCSNPIWAIGTNADDIPQIPKPNSDLQTERGTERPYQVGGSYETQTARPIVVYKTNTRDDWARGEIQAVKNNLEKKDKLWQGQIRANRQALTTAEQERVKICKDIASLNTNVTGLTGRVDALEEGEKTTNKNFEILNRKEKTNFQYTIAAFIVSCAALAGVAFLFFKK